MKVIIITGASSGIGLTTAKYFVTKGYKVYGIAKDKYQGNEFTCYQADVCDYASIDKIFAEIYKKEGHIDALFNNAGFGIAGAMEDASKEKIQNIVNVNLVAVTTLSSKIIPYLRKSGGGRIVNTSSVGGLMPLPYQAMYSATKAGVEVYSRALDNEVRPFNIRVIAVLPGDTKTGFTAAREFEDKNSGNGEAAARSIAKMAKDEQNGADPITVSKAVYQVIEAKNPPLRKIVGLVSNLECFVIRLLPLRFINFVISKMYC